ncbi:MAG TPA: YfhO family protein [Polyangiaceae bacterium]|nr:YfhO family protein [Polyangiaceae bacterium]
MNRRIWDFLVPLSLVLLMIAAFLGVFIRPGLVDHGRTSLMTSSDFHAYFVPRFVLGSEEVFQGRLPAWNPYEYGGIPLLATGQPAALYPPKVLLFGLFPPIKALWLYLWIHYIALALTFLLFMRQQGFGMAAALAGVAVWVFPTPLLGSAYNPVRIANLVWMPLVFLFAERLAKSLTVRSFAALALVVALQLVAGYPECTIDTGFLMLVHAAVSMWTGRWTGSFVRTFGAITGAFVLGGITAGAQLLPLAELGVASHRAHMEIAPAQMPPDYAAITFTFVPGLVAIVAAGLGAPRSRTPLAGLAVCWFMSLGGWLVLRKLPGFHMTRFPFVWVFLSSFFVAWVAASGMEFLLQPAPERRRARRIALGVVAVLAAAMAVRVGLEWPKLPFSGKPPNPMARYLGTPFAAGMSLAAAVSLVVAVAVTLWRRAYTLVWLVPLTLAPLAHLSAYPYGAMPAPFRRPTARGVVATLHGDPSKIRGRCFSPEDLLYGYEVTDHLPSLLGVEFSFLPWRARRLLDRFDFLPMYGHIDWAKLLAARGYLAALDVEFIAGDVMYSNVYVSSGLKPVRRSGNQMLFQNGTRLGHAWVNYAVRRIDAEEKVLDYVIGPHFDPRLEVVLEEDTRHVLPETTPSPVDYPTAERRRSPTDVEWDVELDRSGVFVVSEAGFPGWEAYVDGKPTRWIPADFLLRAVELDRGKHTVRFVYRPWSLRWGVVLSLVGLAGILGLFVAPAFRRRRRDVLAPTPTP